MEIHVLYCILNPSMVLPLSQLNLHCEKTLLASSIKHPPSGSGSIGGKSSSVDGAEAAVHLH